MQENKFTIKFSHLYDKIPLEVDAETPIHRAQLLAVFLIDSSELREIFIEYDTRFLTTSDEEGKCWGHYPLPKGKLLILLLAGLYDSMKEEAPALFTTIRSKIGKGGMDKETYYRSHIGDIAELLIEKEA